MRLLWPLPNSATSLWDNLLPVCSSCSVKVPHKNDLGTQIPFCPPEVPRPVLNRTVNVTSWTLPQPLPSSPPVRHMCNPHSLRHLPRESHAYKRTLPSHLGNLPSALRKQTDKPDYSWLNITLNCFPGICTFIWNLEAWKRYWNPVIITVTSQIPRPSGFHFQGLSLSQPLN